MTIVIREFGIADATQLKDLLDVVQTGWVDLLAPGANGPLALIADPV